MIPGLIGVSDYDGQRAHIGNSTYEAGIIGISACDGSFKI